MPETGTRGAMPHHGGSDLSRRFAGLLVLCGLPLLLLVLVLAWSTYVRS